MFFGDGCEGWPFFFKGLLHASQAVRRLKPGTMPADATGGHASMGLGLPHASLLPLEIGHLPVGVRSSHASSDPYACIGNECKANNHG